MHHEMHMHETKILIPKCGSCISVNEKLFFNFILGLLDIRYLQ